MCVNYAELKWALSGDRMINWEEIGQATKATFFLIEV